MDELTLEQHAERASNRSGHGRTYQMMSAEDLARLPPIQWLVRGVLPVSGLGAIYGPPGCGKTFLALDLGAAVSNGRQWFGHRVKPAPVCYVALEGEAGIAQRVRAYRERNRDALGSMHFVTGSFSLLRMQDTAALANAIRDAEASGGLIIIDTLNRAAPGEDENSPDGMGRILAGCKGLLHAVGGAVLLVHHSGKDSGRGPRGHSSFLAAIDAGIEVMNNDGRREWRAAKVKDGGDGAIFRFKLDPVELGQDDEGEPVTSCVVSTEGDGAPVLTRNRKPPTGGNQRIIWNALGELLRNSNAYGMAGAPPTRPCVRLDVAIDALKDRLACDPDQRAYRTRLAITGLVSHELIMLKDDWLWCA